MPPHKRSNRICITGVETDADLVAESRRNIEAITGWCRAHGFVVLAQIIQADFLSTQRWRTHAVNANADIPIDICIMTPPYPRIAYQDSETATIARNGLASAGNLHAAFCENAWRQVRTGGQMTAVTPRKARTNPGRQVRQPDASRRGARAGTITTHQAAQQATRPDSRATRLDRSEHSVVRRRRRSIPETEVPVRDERPGGERRSRHALDLERLVDDDVVIAGAGTAAHHRSGALDDTVGQPNSKLNKPTIGGERSEVHVEPRGATETTGEGQSRKRARDE